jgi:hypothetical protein
MVSRPRPNHVGLQAYWDGAQWHLGATRLAETSEVVIWIIGGVLGLALSAVFPPFLVILAGIGLWIWGSKEVKRKELRNQAEWLRQQEPPR